MVKTVQGLCRKYRFEVLNLTLNELSNISGFKVSTLGAFERERSSNLNIMLAYVREMNAIEFRKFTIELYEIAEGNKVGE